ncbi:MAG: hypothetical protein U0411_07230 [Thermodesulfovibrionales bacterium]
MRKIVMVIAFCAAIAFAAVAVAGTENPDLKERKRILIFHTMSGVDGLFVKEENPVREVVGDELPWEIQFVWGKLNTIGHLEILVKGLVFKDDPSVPAELRGINDETEFRGLVSCLTEENGSVVTKNVTTQGFPATTEGDSFINADIELPRPCVAPLIMILAGSEDKWFAMTGFEGAEEE